MPAMETGQSAWRWPRSTARRCCPTTWFPPPHVCRVAEKLIEQKLRENFFACWIDFQCSFRVTEFEALMYLQARFSEISRTNNDTELQ